MVGRAAGVGLRGGMGFVGDVAISGLPLGGSLGALIIPLSIPLRDKNLR